MEFCSREPIHIPGAIQPHGVLLALAEPGQAVAQVSANSAVLLGIPPAELLGRPFAALLSGSSRARFEVAVGAKNPAKASPILLTIGDREFDALLHRHESALIVELEPAPGDAENLGLYHRRLQDYLGEMQRAADPAALYAVISRAVSDLTGYERVMVYQFDTDWHGETVAETLTSEVDSYMGLHFPASDIPEQARALYARSWLRIIPAVDYIPAALEPPLNPATGLPLDLSFSVLRSVSPIHLEYLRNMNVGASMSISLMVAGRLWGLIACHHRTPRPLPFVLRAACELFGQIASREIASQQEHRRLAERAEINQIQTRFFDVLAREDNAAEALLRYTPTLLEFMNARGAAIAMDGQLSLVGQTPARAETRALLEWLQARQDEDGIFHSDCLSREWAPAAEFKEAASGLLSIKLSRVEPQYLLWFRPEVLTTVRWAGNPEKPADPHARISPRKSFASWQQTVAGHAAPWKEAEINGAHELRLALNALVIRRTERLMRLNSELERKNTDLNSFAHIASHDLKEPLRGIHHFSQFLREDHAAELGEEGLRKVDTIASLAAHTNELIAVLGRFSEIGRMELAVRETNLDQVLDDVLASLSVTLRESHVEVRRPRPLPEERCDLVLVREVFANLIANAVKYNERETKRVEVSYQDPQPEEEARGPVYYVRDNGIGIRERNLETVFQMFRRLNKNRFGSGSGAGLAIVKSIVERHGGRVWAESTFGEGTTFYFTLR